jgi:trimeric autotransporter adhesin
LYCTGADSIYFQIVERPIADFEYAHFPRNSSGIPFHFINRSLKSNIWLWSFNNTDTSSRYSPDHTFPDTGYAKVRLMVSNSGLCFDTTEKTIPVLDKIEFYLPNVVSPDGNNINDGFGLAPGQWSLVKEFHIEIYNRWGEKVFETNDPREYWMAANFQQGVYIYMATIRDIYNILHEDIKGIITVYR